MLVAKILAWMWCAYWLLEFIHHQRVRNAMRRVSWLVYLTTSPKWHALWLSAAGAVVGWLA